MALARFEGSAIRLAYEGRLTAADVDPMTQPLAALALLDEGRGKPEWVRLFVSNPLSEVREKLASCPSLPEDVLRTLVADHVVSVVAELALWAPSEMATKLASHQHTDVRCAIAANATTPPAVLAALLTGEGLPPATLCKVCEQQPVPFVHAPDCDLPHCTLPPGAACSGSHESAVHDIQQSALANPATATDAVLNFVDHPSLLLRVALAGRTDLPPEAYARLAEDKIPWVRSRVAENPAIDEALMRVLATDRGHDVQRNLAHNPNVPLDILAMLAGTVRIGATLLPRISAAGVDEVEELAASASPSVRMLLAQRRDLPARIRDRLAADPDAKVLKAIAPHPGLPEATLRSMIAKHGTRVLARVAANPDASSALLEDIARHQPPAQKAFRVIARHPNASAAALLICLRDHQARPIAAAHPALPTQMIVDLLDDPEQRTAEAAASNPSLPRAVTARLIPEPGRRSGPDPDASRTRSPVRPEPRP